jgi:ABC-type transport system substrate-binding protein
MKELGILAIFILTFSMVVLLPARADSIPIPGTTVETQWVPSGPAADQIQYQIYADETGEFNALQAGQIDLTDIPMNPPQVRVFCPTGTNFWCTGVAPNPPDDEFGFQTSI